ncbi:conserved hypothetical protein [Trichinella spiralis]|uniref:hypothetical protein n=1 Tax=Trichinella spiralis TaxID=6334 RepID=UPI0001EFE887|nr:conserved hypothetical protein [Trichinella spiralis]
MTYRLTIGDIEEVTLSNFLTDDLHIDYYEDDILKTKIIFKTFNVKSHKQQYMRYRFRILTIILPLTFTYN